MSSRKLSKPSSTRCKARADRKRPAAARRSRFTKRPSRNGIVTESLYKSLFEFLPSSVVLLDARGHVRDANPVFCEQIGYTREELLGKHVSLFSKESTSGIEENIARMMAGETLDHEVTNVQKDGSLRFYELRETAITLPDGSRGILAVSNDITDRKLAEQKHLEMERRLQHAEKLESLGVLAGGIAHDFNNLLTVILGNLEMAQTELPRESRVRKYLNDSHKAGQRAADLTRQMLAYSGRGQYVTSAVHLSQLVGEMAELLLVSVSKNALLELDLSPHMPFIIADAVQLQQVVMNLIINASEAIGANPGHIRISTGMCDCDAAFLEQNRAPNRALPGHYAFLEVCDDGCGMDEAVQEKLFDPFFTTKFTGRGLGMSSVLGVVKGHNGAITLKSQPGQGTTIRVFFPATETNRTPSPQGPASPLNAPVEQPPLAGCVLVAEDEPSVLKLAVDILQRLGLKVISAINGEEAAALFRSHADEISFCLLDLTMPKMDGVAAFSKMRAARPQARAVLTSGFDAEDVKRRFHRHGFAAFIQKPYKVETLARLARQFCEAR